MKRTIQYKIGIMDDEGDVIDEGVFLCIGDTYTKVCDDPSEFHGIVNQLIDIQKKLETRFPKV